MRHRALRYRDRFPSLDLEDDIDLGRQEARAVKTARRNGGLPFVIKTTDTGALIKRNGNSRGLTSRALKLVATRASSSFTI